MKNPKEVDVKFFNSRWEYSSSTSAELYEEEYKSWLTQLMLERLLKRLKNVSSRDSEF